MARPIIRATHPPSRASLHHTTPQDAPHQNNEQVGCNPTRGSPTPHHPTKHVTSQPQQVSPTTQPKTARSLAKRQAEAAKKANEAANRKVSKQREFEVEEEGEVEREDRVPPGTPDNKKRGRDTPATPKKYETHC